MDKKIIDPKELRDRAFHEPRGFCATPYSRRHLRDFNPFDPKQFIPRLDREALQEDIPRLLERTADPLASVQGLVNDLNEIQTTYFWPASVVSLVLFSDKGKPEVFNADSVPLKLSLKDWQLDKPGSVANYAAKQPGYCLFPNNSGKRLASYYIFPEDGAEALEKAAQEKNPHLLDQLQNVPWLTGSTAGPSAKGKVDYSLLRLDEKQMRCSVLVPLRHEGKLLGYIYIAVPRGNAWFYTGDPSDFTDLVLWDLQQIFHVFALALTELRLKQGG